MTPTEPASLTDRVADAGSYSCIAATTQAEINLFAATYVSPVQPAGASLCTLCGTVIRNKQWRKEKASRISLNQLYNNQKMAKLILFSTAWLD